MITLKGVTNPSASTHTFLIQSYQDNTLDKLQCEGTTTITLRNISIQECSLEVQASHLTIGRSAFYSFSILCRNIVRNQSDLRVAVPKDFSMNNPIGEYDCWSSNPFNLVSKCRLIYENATVFILFPDLRV